MAKKRYAVVGTGGRCEMYIRAAAKTHNDVAELVALCDVNPKRVAFYNNVFLKEECDHAPVAAYTADEFDKMIAETKPDVVIVTTIDRTHHYYGCRAMELGCDVISEKPMTVDPEKCQQIIDTQKKTGRKYTVTFNYRYSPRNTKIKELIKSGICGDITSVHFEWLLDTSHGADYFRRWHRNKRNSGGLMIHKSTHHFDLVNWWLDSQPELVFALGDLKFYGKENAEKRGVTQFYSRARNSEVAAKDPFALHVKPGTRIDALYYQAEDADSYYRDQSVFGDGIDIEDNMNVLVRYKNKVQMSYSLCAHCPWEGYRVAFNGTKGRLEFNVVEQGFTKADEDLSVFGMREDEAEDIRKDMVPEIIFQPFWGKPQVITYDEGDKSGHGGGDAKLLKNLFVGNTDDPLGHYADFTDGAQSILTGIGANNAMRTGLPVKVQELIEF